MVQGYCVKDKKMVDIQSPKEMKTKRGTKMVKGKCPHCGITVCRIGG